MAGWGQPDRALLGQPGWPCRASQVGRARPAGLSGRGLARLARLTGPTDPGRLGSGQTLANLEDRTKLVSSGEPKNTNASKMILNDIKAHMLSIITHISVQEMIDTYMVTFLAGIQTCPLGPSPLGSNGPLNQSSGLEWPSGP